MIQLRTFNVSELHALTHDLVQRGMEAVAVCATDGRARYPFQAYTVLSAAGYTDALLLNVRPDAHFAQPSPLPINWGPGRVAEWNEAADRIKTTCGAFADKHHPAAPSAYGMKQALEKIWNSAHPDAAEHMPELRGISEAAYGEWLVRIAGEALGRL